MRVRVDTVAGGVTYRVHGTRDLAQLLLPAMEAAEEDVRSGRFPRLYSSHVRYRRERPSWFGIEWFKRPSTYYPLGCGDCDDLAPTRAAELRVSGEDRAALPAIIRSGPGLLHVVVVRGDGTIEDPSRALGMGGKRVQPKFGIRRVGGCYVGAIRVPTTRSVVRARARGRTGAQALGRAADAAAMTLAEMGLAGEPEIGFGFADAAELAGPYIEKGYQALKSWLTGTNYDAFGDYVKAVAEKDAGIAKADQAKDTKKLLAQVLGAGIVPVYCSDSEGCRDNILREFESRGWTGKSWSQAYSSGLGRKTWWYGVTLNVSDAPADLVSRAKAKAAQDETKSAADTLKFCADAKHQMKAYGGREDYDQMFLNAYPAIPSQEVTKVSDAQVSVGPRKSPLAADSAGPASDATPDMLGPTARDFMSTTRALSDLGRAGDWAALARLASTVQREGGSGTISRLARALVTTRRW